MRVVSFNILAPCWAHPKYYNNKFGDLLNSAVRLPKVKRQVVALSKNADVICLQETMPEFLLLLFSGQDGLDKHEWQLFHAEHAAEYWQNWWITSPEEIAVAPWTLNHNDHGVSIVVRRSSFTNVKFSSVISETGNGQAFLSADYNNIPIGLACVHYDSDSSNNRVKELNTTIATLESFNPVAKIIAGDFNFDTNSGNLSNILTKAKLIDAMYSLNLNRPTHPFSSSYYRSFNYGTIDHVVSQGFLSGQPSFVLDNYLFELFPIKPPPDRESERIQDNFRLCGSDHFPLIITLM